MNVKELKRELASVLTEVRDLAAKAESEGRQFTDDETTQIKSGIDKAAVLKGRIKEAEGDDALRKAIADLGDTIGLAPDDGRPDPAAGRAAPKGSVGERFVNSPEYKAWLTHVAPQGHIPEKAAIQSPAIQFGGFKDLLTGADATSGGAFVQTDYTGIYEPLGRRPLTIRDIISTRTTGSDLVEYVRQTARTNAAAPVAEATATSGSSGTKPEGGLTFEKVTEPVKTIAEWIPATKRAIADAGQLRGIIDQELRDDLEEQLEDQMLTGDGTGENFTGLLNVSGTQSQAFDTDLLTTTRKARTKVRTVGRATATAYVLHPLDWEAIDLLQDNEARYYFGGPMQLGTPRLWGLPVVESEGITQGTGLCADFRKAILWDREQASIQVSDSHADFFIRNMVAVLGELRAAFGVTRPAAFVEIDLTA